MRRARPRRRTGLGALLPLLLAALTAAVAPGCGDDDAPAIDAPSGAPDGGDSDAGGAGADAAGAIDGGTDAAPMKTDREKLMELLAALATAPDDATRAALVEAFVLDVTYGVDGFP